MKSPKAGVPGTKHNWMGQPKKMKNGKAMDRIREATYKKIEH
jgi:hypothetical protein